MPFHPLALFKKTVKKRASTHTNFGCVFRYKLGVRRNGQDIWLKDWRNNLILDSGLDKMSGRRFNDCWFTCLFGNQVAPMPVSRDSLTIIFNTSGATCSASGSFFQSADVGRLIKFDDVAGTEAYITSFTDSTHVGLSLTPSPAIVSQTATIWYVNETALQSLYATTSTYDQTGGANGTSAIANVITYKRTFLGAAVGGNVTLTEIGFSDSTTNSDLFDRDIITGGIALVTGDQPLAVAELILTMGPAVSTPVGNVATGFDSSGDCIISGLAYNNAGQGAIVPILTNGNTATGAGYLEPTSGGSFSNNISLYNTSQAVVAFDNGNGTAITGFADSDSVTLGPYSSGTFFRDRIYVFGVTTGNSPNIYGIFMRNAGTGGTVFQLALTASFAKLSTQVLTVALRASWQRILMN